MSRLLPVMMICVTLPLTGCTNEPELQSQVTPELRQAEYPKLLPLEQTLAPQPLQQEQSAELQRHLDAQGWALQRRAEALRRAAF